MGHLSLSSSLNQSLSLSVYGIFRRVAFDVTDIASALIFYCILHSTCMYVHQMTMHLCVV
ncbi:hypothetical protein EX30DRAFT_341764 [Ascodesmis nigricans]|uniref:Uncharacterized protein n=1 Tax=Ascodesmis nigricans TaxID=341454 RepID=A0A4S2MUE4_9PEZI|nr:hypothetical protein EX30DRAFT_341764 [Ascodesmis nigricans]